MTAGLQSLPDEVLEAARLDGAGGWTMFWRVTVPLLSPTIFFGLVVGHDLRLPELRADRHPDRLAKPAVHLH